MLALLALALSSGAPQPREVKTFRDWIVGCDNGRECQAVALAGEGEPVMASLSVTRGAEAGAAPRILITSWEHEPVAAIIEGKRFPLRRIGPADEQAFEPIDAAAFLAALIPARSVAVIDRAGKDTRPISPAGAAAALLFMDDQQRRLGTVTALVRKGPATAVPAPPPLPVIVRAPSAGAAATLSAEQTAQLFRETQCEGEDPPDTTRKVLIDAVDARHSLVMIPCGAGAYNYMSVPYLATRAGGQVTLKPAPFDYDPDGREGDPTTMINAGWDTERRLLTAFAKGRGIGDCGIEHAYAWDGERFRLAELRAMPTCRGSIDWIRIWRAEVRDAR